MSFLKKIFVLFFLIIPFFVFSQNKKNKEPGLPALPSECFYFKFNQENNTSTTPLPFNKILISDVRPDTSKFGYYYNVNTSTQIKLCIKVSATTALSFFFNSYFSKNFSPSKNIIHAFIKKVCFKNRKPDNEIGNKYSGYDILLKIEFYLQIETCYYPLYRFDSTFSGNWKLSRPFEKLINDCFIASAQKLLVPELYDIQKKNCLSRLQIDSFNNSLKNCPILSSTNRTKGIFLNFNQFKEKEPAFTEFQTSFSEIADVLYVKGQMIKDSAIIDSWGFSDGENYFIRQGNNFFPLYPSGNNFDFLGFDNINVNQPFYGSPNPHGTRDLKLDAISAGVSGLLSSIRIKSKYLQLYILDMETGKIY